MHNSLAVVRLPFMQLGHSDAASAHVSIVPEEADGVLH